MIRSSLRTCVLVSSMMFFLTLVLPFCVSPAESIMLLPGGGSGPQPPPPPPADPDDIAVNSARGYVGNVSEGRGFGNETCSIIAGSVMSTEQYKSFMEVPVASKSRGGSGWLLLVWMLTSNIH